MKVFKLILASILCCVFHVAQAEDGVARSAFTSAIEEKEPVDQITELSNDKSKILFFTEIRGMEGHTITHRWEQGGEVRAEVSFNVGANRWRVWSSKNLQNTWLGEWIVSVIDEGGNTLTQERFNYIEAPAAIEVDKAVEAPTAE